MKPEVRAAAKQMHPAKKLSGYLGVLVIVVALALPIMPAFVDFEPSAMVVIMFFLGGLVMLGVPIKDLIDAWRK